MVGCYILDIRRQLVLCLANGLDEWGRYFEMSWITILCVRNIRIYVVSHNCFQHYSIVESIIAQPTKTGSDLLAGGHVLNAVSQLALVALAACQGDVGQDVEYLA